MSNPAPEAEKKATVPPETDVEGGEVAAVSARSSGLGVGSVLRRWKRDDYLRKGSLGLRALGLFFSLLSFIIMASNNHGDWKQFGKYEEYRYVLAIAILSTIYTGVQTCKQVHQLSTGKELMAFQNWALIDFVGDQDGTSLACGPVSSTKFYKPAAEDSTSGIRADGSAWGRKVRCGDRSRWRGEASWLRSSTTVGLSPLVDQRCGVASRGVAWSARHGVVSGAE